MSDFYAGRRVVITGGAGFIGSNLAHRLVELGANVVIVDSMIPAYGADLSHLGPIRDRITLNFSDIRDRYSLEYLVRGRDVLFSLAGQVSHIDSMTDPFTDLEINCKAQLSLLEVCRHVNPGLKIVFASTRQVYGRPRYVPIDETHPLDPVDVNGVNNLAAEMYYSLYHRVYGIRAVNLRLTNTYGPRMDLRNPHKGVVGVFVGQALRGETVRLFGTGEQRRDFNHVDDVVQALLVAGESSAVDGESFNLGHPRPRSLREFVEVLGRFADFPVEVVPFPEDRKKIDVGDYYGSFEKFRSRTGWTPAVDLEEGLAQTIAFFRERPATWR